MSKDWRVRQNEIMTTLGGVHPAVAAEARSFLGAMSDDEKSKMSGKASLGIHLGRSEANAQRRNLRRAALFAFLTIGKGSVYHDHRTFDNFEAFKRRVAGLAADQITDLIWRIFQKRAATAGWLERDVRVATQGGAYYRARTPDGWSRGYTLQAQAANCVPTAVAVAAGLVGEQVDPVVVGAMIRLDEGGTAADRRAAVRVEGYAAQGAQLRLGVLEALQLNAQVIESSAIVGRSSQRTPAIVSYYNPKNPASGHEVVVIGRIRFGDTALLGILDPQIGLQYVDPESPRRYRPWIGGDWHLGLPPYFLLRRRATQRQATTARRRGRPAAAGGRQRR